MNNNLSLDEIDNKISELENQKQQIKDDIKTNAKKQGWFYLLNTTFESASYKTKEYLDFHRQFKREFTKLLKDNYKVKEVLISKANHFDASGFFKTSNDIIFYFSIGDLRWDKVFLIRTAQNYKDYTGGSNEYLNTENYNEFLKGLERLIKK